MKTNHAERRPKPVEIVPLPEVRKHKGHGEAVEKIQERDILAVIGPWGTGKTHIATTLALHAMRLKQIERVIVTRPNRPLDDDPQEELGFLPGGPGDKLRPYLLPFLDVLRRIVGVDAAEKVFQSFEPLALAHVQGRNFDRCYAILDEAQNARRSQRKAWMGRMCLGSKLILCGDPLQCSNPEGGESFVEEMIELERDGIAGIVWLDEAMQCRHPLLPRIQKAYERLASAKTQTKKKPGRGA